MNLECHKVRNGEGKPYHNDDGQLFFKVKFILHVSDCKEKQDKSKCLKPVHDEEDTEVDFYDETLCILKSIVIVALCCFIHGHNHVEVRLNEGHDSKDDVR